MSHLFLILQQFIMPGSIAVRGDSITHKQGKLCNQPTVAEPFEVAERQARPQICWWGVVKHPVSTLDASQSLPAPTVRTILSLLLSSCQQHGVLLSAQSVFN